MSENKGVLIFAEQNDGEIHPVTYELINKGKMLADQLKTELYTVILGGPDLEVDELIYRGSDKVFYLINEEFNSPNPVLYKDYLKKYIEEKINPEIILIGATLFGRSLAPRLAISLKSGLTADCTDLEIDSSDNKLIQIRPAFSENILAHIKTTSFLQMATVRYQEFETAERDLSRTGEIIKEDIKVQKDNSLNIIDQLASKDIDITNAEVIVAGGKGLKNPEDFSLLRKLADILGGELGASRDVVDEDYISKNHQVGYSGNRVKPIIYIACGISGAPQHLAGMKESDTIIAINTDSSAPIFNHCDYGIVGDLYDIIPKWIKKLEDDN